MEQFFSSVFHALPLPSTFLSLLQRRSIDLSLEINSLRHTAEDTSIGSLRGVFDTPRRRTPKLALTRADYAIPNTYTRFVLCVHDL